MMRNKTFVIGSLLGLFIALAPPVSAAPQILGLVVSVEPTKLQCENGVCSAEFSAFCMQEHRKSPKAGTAYLPSKNTQLTLSVAGKQIPLLSQATYSSIRNYTAVQISLPEQIVRSFGAGPASLSVGKMASLIPVAKTDDPNPISQQEAIVFTGPLRSYADRASAEKNPNIEAARLVSRMVNALPKNGDASEVKRLGLWQKEIGQRSWRVSDKAYKHASKAFRICKGDFNKYGLDGMRSCLEIYHDSAMTDVTKKVWKELKPGG